MANGNGEERDDLRGASISPRERLERIEKMLERIDDKLDSKADLITVVALNQKVESILQDAVWSNRAVLVGEFEEVKERIESMERDGSKTSQNAHVRISKVEAKADKTDRKVVWAAGAVSTAVFIANIAVAKGWI